MDRCCYNCKNLRYGWRNDPNPCDYTCERKLSSFTIRKYLFCTHGMTREEIENKLRSMGNDCEYFIPINHNILLGLSLIHI